MPQSGHSAGLRLLVSCVLILLCSVTPQFACLAWFLKNAVPDLSFAKLLGRVEERWRGIKEFSLHDYAPLAQSSVLGGVAHHIPISLAGEARLRDCSPWPECSWNGQNHVS